MTINIGLLDEESAVEAIEFVDELAQENSIEWALVGGLAMALYGSDRTTKDIDIISPTSFFRLKNRRSGSRRRALSYKKNKKEVAVDWIIRRGCFQAIVRRSLERISQNKRCSRSHARMARHP